LVLLDSSIWIDHLREPDTLLSALLQRAELLMHPLVLGEIAMGNMKGRASRMEFLSSLPPADIAENADVVELVHQQHLYGTGLGFVDAHLLASARLMPQTFLWTRDKRLLAAARRLSVAFEEPGRRVQ
jgi:predicted nucleic acid-binding protein